MENGLDYSGDEKKSQKTVNTKVVLMVVLVASSLLWMTGLAFVAKSPKPPVERVPANVAQAVWELDAAVHRLMSGEEFGGDDIYEADRGRLTLAVEKVSIAQKLGNTHFHGSLDTLMMAAGGVLKALDGGDRLTAVEHAVKFREAAVTTEMGIVPAQDEDDERREQGIGYLIGSGLFMMVGFFILVRKYSVSEANLALLRERAGSEELEMKSISEKLVAAENHLAAMRGIVDQQVKDKKKLEGEIDLQKGEVQRQMLARSALERQLENALSKQKVSA